YNYLYQAAALVDGVADTPSFDLTCSVLVSTSESACQAQFQVTECELKESDGKTDNKVKHSEDLSRDLSKYPFFVDYCVATENETKITELHVSASEGSTTVLNLKRGIVSALLLPALPQIHHDESAHVMHVVQNDIFGSCPTK
ncbi:hypothetical protein EGW08_017824, partial [Elysia chlorotica]